MLNIKLSGFTELLKVRAAEAKTPFSYQVDMEMERAFERKRVLWT